MKFSRDDYSKRIIDTAGKIPEDEPVFLLRGQDKYAPELLLMWSTKLRLDRGDPELARAAEDHAQSMIEWQEIHGIKTPDMISSESRKEVINKIRTLISDSSHLSFSEIFRKVGILSNQIGISDKHIIILMQEDLDPIHSDIPVGFLNIDHFKIPEENLTNFRDAKLIFYVNRMGEFSVIKDELR